MVRFGQSSLNTAFFVLLILSPSNFASGQNLKFFEPIQPPRRFQVMVHRGEAKQAPENTAPALQRCIDDGLEWAEVDVRLSKDRQHLLSHDPQVTDASGRQWEISGHTLEELLTLDIGSSFAPCYAGERLLSLRAALQLANGKLNLYLDCKAVDPELLARDVLSASMGTQVIVFDELDHLQGIGAVAPGKVATMAKWRPALGPPAWAQSNHLDSVEIDAPDITPEAVQAFRRLGIKVQVKSLGEWDQPTVWTRVIAAGVDWIQTDLPEELLAHDLWARLQKRPVRFSLHRGAGRYAPENTLPAFEKAIRLGADFVEFDVRTTVDGKFFLLHDWKLERTTDGSGAIADRTSTEVQTLSAGAKFAKPYATVRVPSLDDFLAAMAGKVDLYFDAKSISPESLVASLERFDVVDRTVVYQSPAYLARLRAINPRIRLLPPLRSPDDLDALAQELKPYAVDADWKILSPELIARCHMLGIQVFSDALGDHENIPDYQQAIQWGIDLIQTDYPLRLFRAMELTAEKHE